MIKIAPSILAADFTKLGKEIIDVDKAGADMIHIDVMDGNFVPNISVGIPVIKSIRKVTGLDFDVHLMVNEPIRFLEDFKEAGADMISVQVESTNHIHRTIQKIKDLNLKAGVVLNPASPLCMIEWLLEDVDMVLLMSVNPGYGGQEYISFVTKKITELRELIVKNNLKVDIQVDGGITPDNIGIVAKAGANVFVAGTAIFGELDRKAVIDKMRKVATLSSKKSRSIKYGSINSSKRKCK